ncbi:hypothetical protein [Sphaerospermopsis reniformis]|nr:hypothetical protein [Sphaerospermopsis reniformis]
MTGDSKKIIVVQKSGVKINLTNHQSPITNHQSPITNHQLCLI